MVLFNKRRVVLWGAMVGVCAAGVAASFMLRSSTVSTFATSPYATVHPTYVLRPLEECSGQRYLTETEMYEVSRQIDEYLSSVPTTVERSGDFWMQPEIPYEQRKMAPEVAATLVPDDDYPPAYYAAVDPDGDHCKNPISDELMMVGWSNLGPGSTTTSTTSTTTSTTSWPTTVVLATLPDPPNAVAPFNEGYGDDGLDDPTPEELAEDALTRDPGEYDRINALPVGDPNKDSPYFSTTTTTVPTTTTTLPAGISTTTTTTVAVSSE